jgi:7-cyano-7-deazaguanine synthase in queuosine biosynthesis
MKRINLSNDTVVDIPDGPIGISCSGGVDSSLLLYILMANCTDTIHIFTLSNDRKGRANAVIVPKVIERCIQLTGNLNVIQHSYYAADQIENTLFDVPREYLKNKTISCIFFAITANPPTDVVFTAQGSEQSNRDPSTIKKEIEHDGFLYQPFVNKDKKTIADIYKQLNLMETLFPVTRSCEQIGKLEYYDHCGKCWWCEERQWGFGRV